MVRLIRLLRCQAIQALLPLTDMATLFVKQALLFVLNPVHLKYGCQTNGDHIRLLQGCVKLALETLTRLVAAATRNPSRWFYARATPPEVVRFAYRHRLFASSRLFRAHSDSATYMIDQEKPFDTPFFISDRSDEATCAYFVDYHRRYRMPLAGASLQSNGILRAPLLVLYPPPTANPARLDHCCS